MGSQSHVKIKAVRGYVPAVRNGVFPDFSKGGVSLSKHGICPIITGV